MAKIRSLVILVSAAPALALSQSFYGLGFFDLSPWSQPWGVSNQGRVVVADSPSTHTGNGSSEHMMAGRWTRHTGLMELGTLGGANLATSYVGRVSADGRTIVGATTTVADPSNLSPFSRGANGQMQVLPPMIPGITWGFAWDCSNDGWFACGRVGNQPVLWTPTGPVDITSGRFGFARGLADNGSVVVGTYEFNGLYLPFRWTQVGGMSDLPTLTGFLRYSFPFDCSADGSRSVGRTCASTTDPNYQVPVLWDGQNVPVQLGWLFSNDRAGTAWATTADGKTIVGSSGSTAFIWSVSRGMRDLNTVLARDYHVKLNNWYLSAATHISADGLAICGYGYHNGNTEGWVFTVPRPGFPLQ